MPVDVNVKYTAREEQGPEKRSFIKPSKAPQLVSKLASRSPGTPSILPTFGEQSSFYPSFPERKEEQRALEGC